MIYNRVYETEEDLNKLIKHIQESQENLMAFLHDGVNHFIEYELPNYKDFLRAVFNDNNRHLTKREINRLCSFALYRLTIDNPEDIPMIKTYCWIMSKKAKEKVPGKFFKQSLDPANYRQDPNGYIIDYDAFELNPKLTPIKLYPNPYGRPNIEPYHCKVWTLDQKIYVDKMEKYNDNTDLEKYIPYANYLYNLQASSVEAKSIFGSEGGIVHKGAGPSYYLELKMIVNNAGSIVDYGDYIKSEYGGPSSCFPKLE